MLLKCLLGNYYTFLHFSFSEQQVFFAGEVMEIISFGHDASQKSFKSNLLNINIRLESKDQKGS